MDMQADSSSSDEEDELVAQIELEQGTYDSKPSDNARSSEEQTSPDKRSLTDETETGDSGSGVTSVYKSTLRPKEHREHKHSKLLSSPPPSTSISTGGSTERLADSTGKTLYKFGSQYKKGGDSWIKKETDGNMSGSAPGSSPKPKQIIPTSDKKQPLAFRHSNMINQCKLSCVIFLNKAKECRMSIFSCSTSIVDIFIDVLFLWIIYYR